MMGYSTELCSSGFQAIYLLEQSANLRKSYAIVLILGESEDMPGREVLLLARQVNESKQKLPILYINKDRDPDEILQIIKEGANDYIVEGQSDSQIVAKIQKFAPLQT